MYNRKNASLTSCATWHHSVYTHIHILFMILLVKEMRVVSTLFIQLLLTKLTYYGPIYGGL